MPEPAERLERREERTVEGLALLAAGEMASNSPVAVAGEFPFGECGHGPGCFAVRSVDGEEENVHERLDAAAAGTVAG